MNKPSEPGLYLCDQRGAPRRHPIYFDGEYGWYAENHIVWWEGDGLENFRRLVVAEEALDSEPSERREPKLVATPGVLGGMERFSGTRISVEAIRQCRMIDWSDARILLAYPSLTEDDLKLVQEATPGPQKPASVREPGRIKGREWDVYQFDYCGRFAVRSKDLDRDGFHDFLGNDGTWGDGRYFDTEAEARAFAERWEGE